MRRLILLLASSALCAAFAQTPCDGLKSLSLPNTTITATELVPAGPYSPPRGGAPGPPAPPIQLPAHCRVAVVMTPSSDSHIEMELWMPAAGWNGKFEAEGGGGWAGVISFPAMADALKEGYATASTDTGHKGGDAIFALGHPEKVIDFSYRSLHEMALKSKAIIQAFYGRPARLSYWNGCSTGGRQGLTEAQRFPDDYDAIVAGAPANYETHLHAWSMMVGMATHETKESFLARADIEVLHKAVLGACDAIDGLKDGLINDPRKCHFDPSVLLCKGGESKGCLTAPQVEAVKKLYTPAKTKSGKLIFPPMEPGSELSWNVLAGGSEPAELVQGTFKYLAHEDKNWDWHTFDLDKDTALADSKDIIDAINPDLSKFKAHGGKLLMYHGWADGLIAPENSINYYNSVLKKMGGRQSDFVRLFMVPGMQHCRGGEGPNQFNVMGALERWRESGTAPDQIIAYHVTGNTVDRTRPLCPYPQVAVYSGVGNIDDAANFSCKMP
jgi:feruloyl esterase